ncbi:SMI1/KNR4 family protein [Capnocytophaga canis]|uniref:SMI1/KNR4 family protein n=2 Tax=Capnocytophaga canis TaxID=1848903 RepID=A0A3A1YGZ0_9FLAO|nr:SMI1/KNR4 family protein [Capnocytophaga canis]
MFLKSSKPISQMDIELLEKKISKKLPIDFVNQYLLSNGGIPSKTYFYVENDDDYVEISFFIPIKYPSDKLANMIVEESYNKLVQIGMPNYYIPFALDWGGNYFSIDTTNNNIILLLTDLGEFSEKSIKYLSQDFKDFIDNLETDG